MAGQDELVVDEGFDNDRYPGVTGIPGAETGIERSQHDRDAGGLHIAHHRNRFAVVVGYLHHRDIVVGKLLAQFGGFGERLWNLARGIDERPVQVDSRRQSISVENTFDRDLPDVDACLAELPGLLDELQRRMQRLDASYRPGKPFVKLKFHDFTQTTLEQANASRDLDSYRQLLNQAFQRGARPVRLIGVGVRLVDLRGRAEQLSLF